MSPNGVFFRHAASAGCDAALVAYGEKLALVLDGLDAHLVAVSPQRADRLAALKRRHEPRPVSRRVRVCGRPPPRR
ncbi:hypothetical protein [Nucisporomicrobium flavum]|uniref:hypothetical protein n=1 Tax=Nucisporomicrobium flavum TaxID=2785915 RepID=UPI0018F4E062|nr:hypothetical protein [Nucisporomicrobium flavum]